MSGVTVTIDDSQVRSMLGRLQRNLDDWTPAMKSIGEFLVGRIKLGFHDGSDPWGAPWLPLSAVTVARRRQASGQPMRDTGRLMNSITSRVTGPHTVDVGTNVKYAATHQFGARKGQYGRTRRGTPIPWGNVPARPFMPLRGNRADLPVDWTREIVRSLRHHVTEAI